MAQIPSTLDALRVDIADLHPYPGNPRRGDVKRIAASLRANGQYRAIVVNRPTMQVLVGNHTYLAARDELGWSEIAATFVEVDDDNAARIVLVDNRSSDESVYDDEALRELLQGLPDLEGTGFSESELLALIPDDDLTPGADTEPMEIPKQPTTRAGDLFVLGDHRLLCGDSTSAEDVDRLLDGDLVDVVFTDPPYGMSFSWGTRKVRLPSIQGDSKRGTDLIALVRDALALAVASKKPSAPVYVWCTWRTYPEFVSAMTAVGLTVGGCIVWKKGRPGPGSADYRPEHEFCLYCAPEDDGDHALCIYCSGDGTWTAGRGESDVWEHPRDSKYVHPTQKPTALAERALEHNTPREAIVLDLFGGSGSTLIAAANLKRRARLMELDPAFCDVIVDRWERHTGQTAVRVRGDGD